MSRGTWQRIKQSKSFYIQNYRVLLVFVIFSGFINVLLCLLAIYVYLNRPAVHYYATSGIAPPIELTVMNTPNYSSEALLPLDPSEESANETAQQRIIPN